MMWIIRDVIKTNSARELTERAGVVIARQSTAVQGRGLGIATMTQVITAVWLSSMAGQMNSVIPWSVTVQRSGDSTVKVHQVAIIDLSYNV